MGSEYKTIIKIPPGDHIFLANIYLWNYNSYPGYGSSGYVRGDGLEITHSFFPGQTYYLFPEIFGRAQREEINIIRYTGTTGYYIWHRGNRPMDGNIGLAHLRDISVRLRIDEDGTPVAYGNVITK